jgi:hypothetical protein
VKRTAAKLSLLALTGLFCLVLLEGGVRLFVDPVNFLRPDLASDPILGRRIEGGSGGHDAWGFRNRAVPESAEIVAIGDSQTYGNTAPADQSWPAWLAKLSGRTVYNLGMGGYGPWEYLHLLETKAFALRPEWVVVGFYFGNDLWDGFRSVYAVDHWASWRDPALIEELEQDDVGLLYLPAASPEGVKQGSGLTSLRQWLRSRSVFYRMLTISLGDLVRPIELKYFFRSNVEFTAIYDEDGELLTALQPVQRSRAVDLENPRIRAGLGLGLRALSEMARLCRERGVRMLVVVIPTKISVFAEAAERLGATEQHHLIARLVANESYARAETLAWLEREGIPHVSVLEDLKRHVGERGLYPRTIDGHPSRNGYRVIAEAAERALSEAGDTPGSGPPRSGSDAPPPPGA